MTTGTEMALPPHKLEPEELADQLEDALSQLKPRQRRFVQEVATGDADNSTCALRAGYSKNNPSEVASSLMKNPAIKHALALQRQQYALATGYTAAWKRQQLAEVVTRGLDEENPNLPAVNAAIRTMCEMDGSFAALQIKHNHLAVSVSLDYQIDLPKRGNVIEGETVDVPELPNWMLAPVSDAKSEGQVNDDGESNQPSTLHPHEIGK